MLVATLKISSILLLDGGIQVDPFLEDYLQASAICTQNDTVHMDLVVPYLSYFHEIQYDSSRNEDYPFYPHPASSFA